MAGTAATNLASVNISDTYYGVLHAGGQNLPPTGQAQIYDGYGTLAAIRVGANCNGVTICGPLSATSLTTTSKLSASTQFDVFNLLNVLHPVGSVIFTTTGDSPSLRSGWSGTTWIQVSQGRFIVGQGTGTDSNGEVKSFSVGNAAGEYRHTLTVAEMPGHTHSLNVEGEQFYITNDNNTSGPTSFGRFRSQGPDDKNDGRYCPILPSAGGSQPHSITPPGFGLYVWQRTT